MSNKFVYFYGIDILLVLEKEYVCIINYEMYNYVVLKKHNLKMKNLYHPFRAQIKPTGLLVF